MQGNGRRFSIAEAERTAWKLEENNPGWVARTRPLAEPLSPRGPQPVVTL